MSFESSVHLQKVFSFSAVWYVLAVVLIAAGVLMLIHGLRLRSLVKEIYPEQYAQKPENIIFSDPKWSRDQCAAALRKILRDFRRNRISARVGWQASSNIIRRYVYSCTGVRVMSFTSGDFRSVNMPRLEELIRECYRPEFEERSDESPELFIERAVKLINSSRLP